MKTQVLHLHRNAPGKPQPGMPCNGCGVCCTLETCPLARLRFLRIQGPCPALEWLETKQRYGCGLLHQPLTYFRILPSWAERSVRHLIARWIASGKGCDCDAEVSD